MDGTHLTDDQVRIVYLPPAWVAAYRYVGDEPESHVNRVMDAFVRETRLTQIKPDLRHYGFNAPNPKDETGCHGYEMWVTIPEGMEVPAPLERKRFEGGLYAAVMIPMGAFEMWDRLNEWVKHSAQYVYCGSGSGEDMGGCLEEHLNYFHHVQQENSEPDNMQLDLLTPVKEKE